LAGLGLLALPLPLAGLGCGPQSGGGGIATPCGTQLCVDLTQSANAALQSVNGSVEIQAPSGDVIIVIRTSATSVVALSAICTHAGCVVGFDASRGLLPCPCHGSVFSESGNVVQGPASLPLRSYAATMSGNQVTIG